MEYDLLSPEDFDAVITGEMAHYAIWFEHELIGIISDHFVIAKKRDDFERLLMLREGLSFQDKIDIVRAAIPLFVNSSAANQLRGLLNKIEQFKATRNALAHGVAAASATGSITVEVVKRDGKPKAITITAKTHKAAMADAEELLEELKEVRSDLPNAVK